MPHRAKHGLLRRNDAEAQPLVPDVRMDGGQAGLQTLSEIVVVKLAVAKGTKWRRIGDTIFLRDAFCSLRGRLDLSFELSPVMIAVQVAQRCFVESVEYGA